MKWNIDAPYCDDLFTTPNPQIGKILITGATGYIGGRLVTEIQNRGYDVRIMVREDSAENIERFPNAEIVVGDALNYNDVKEATDGVQVIYYLIHSLLLGKDKFESADTKAAINFRNASELNNVKRIIYLGALGEESKKLSSHLKSRLQVAEELSKGKVPVTILRAAVIIGSGSASFEIIKNLVNNTPILLIPRWARTQCQPIGVRDVIKYLVGVLETENTENRSFDIGGKDLLSYKEMLTICATLLNKKRLFLDTFFSNYTVYGYIAGVITPVPAPIVFSLIKGGSNEVICRENHIQELLDFEVLSYSQSILHALDREEHDKIRTRWSDAYPPAHELAIKLHELPAPRYRDSYSLITNASSTQLFNSICKIGGKSGWFHSNWMWRLRGVIDTMFMGVGMIRGRRSYSTLRLNDVIDFWRIEDIVKNRRLLLRAEMILPGKAWLEFKIDELETNNKLTVIAHFHPKGFAGKLYWYTFLPFHNIIFNNLHFNSFFFNSVSCTLKCFVYNINAGNLPSSFR
jgi:uncharacterized protein YbjT (DUF2867 family)